MIERIVHLVATHDDAYLGKPQVTIGEKYIRDADVCFDLSQISFWKDYYLKCAAKGFKITPNEFLDKKIIAGSKRYTLTAQKITDQQIADRRKEIANKSKTPKQRYQELRTYVDKLNRKTLSDE